MSSYFNGRNQAAEWRLIDESQIEQSAAQTCRDGGRHLVTADDHARARRAFGSQRTTGHPEVSAEVGGDVTAWERSSRRHRDTSTPRFPRRKRASARNWSGKDSVNGVRLSKSGPFEFMAWMVLALFAFIVQARAAPIHLESPDHPPAWYDRTSEKVSQDLTWDASRQLLVLSVAYSYEPTVRQRDPLSYDTFRLSFPAVHLDQSAGGLFFTGEHGERIEIGRLRPGLFHSHVVLNPGIEAVVRRDPSVLSAALQSAKQ